MKKCLFGVILSSLMFGCCNNDVYVHPDSRTYADLVGREAAVIKQTKDDIVMLKNKYGEIKVSLIGANVFSYIPKGGEEVLFSVKNPDFTMKDFLHAGIPVVWPWFNMNGEAGSTIHAFARQLRWKVAKKEMTDEVFRLVLELESNSDTLRLWPYKFKLVYTIELSQSLTVSLRTKNTDDVPFFITEGYHSYFKVSDVNSVVLRGLDGVLNDAIACGAWNKPFKGDLKFHAGEGRVFFPGRGEYVLFDEGMNRAITLAARGHKKLILWSIPQKASSGQFGPDDWKHFVCLEPSTISREAQVKVLPNREHELRMTIKAVPLK